MEFKGICVSDGKARKIVVENGIYNSVEETEYNGDTYLSPGFTDMQVNGYLGIDYSGPDLTVEGIRKVTVALMKTGTLHHVATIITNSEERIIRNLRVMAEAVRTDELIKNSLLGIHIEGPFIAMKDGPRGAHDPKYVRKPDIEEAKRWQKAAEGLVKIITVAPEQEGAAEFTKQATKLGFHVAIGHCEPTDEQINNMVEAGATLSTHLGNGSSAMLPRLKNHIWTQLADDRLSAGIISDSFHLPLSVLKAFRRTKGLDKLILVSDVIPHAGLKPGPSKWGDINVEICEDGHIALAGTSLLAGAGHLLDWDLRVFCEATGTPLEDAIRTVTINPMRSIGEKEDFSFRPGNKADIIAFRKGSRRLEIINYALGSVMG